MVLRIRLARFGNAHSPIYNIVLAHARTARDSRPLEVLGTYDPKPKTPLASADTPEYIIDEVTGERRAFVPRRYKDVKLDRARVKYWLGVGAKCSERVERILHMVGLMEMDPRKAKLRPTDAQIETKSETQPDTR